MFIESLDTPHFRKMHHGFPQPLAETAELLDMAQLVEAAEILAPELLDDVRIDAALEISKHVNRSLWFPQKTDQGDDFTELGIPFPIPLETLPEKQTTNCYGYTIVTSECLEMVGIPHYVGYLNDHAAIVLPTSKGLYYLDSLYPKLNQFLDAAVGSGNTVGLDEKIAQNKRQALLIDTEQMAGNVGKRLHDLPQDVLSWMLYISGNETPAAALDKLHRVPITQVSSRLIMSLYEPEVGRKTLQNYVALDCAINGQTPDVFAAVKALDTMAGLYPNIDARQHHSEVRRICKLVAQRDPQQAAEIAQKHFDESFAITEDTRIAMAKGDILCLIARIGMSGPIARLAVRTYEGIVNNPRAYKETITGKYIKASGLLKHLTEDAT